MPAKKPPPRPEMGGVTRIDIVTELGRYTFWGDSWRYDEQDDGRTVKLFAKGDGKAAQAEQRAAFAKDIGEQQEFTQRMLADQEKREKAK